MIGSQPRALLDRVPANASTDLLAFFSDVVGRLEIAIRSETDALGQNQPFDMGDINRQKRQGLLELSRVMPRLTGPVLQGAVRDRLDGLAELLDENRTAIDVQLRAVREVADIIAATIKEAESDGTYSRFGVVR